MASLKQVETTEDPLQAPPKSDSGEQTGGEKTAPGPDETKGSNDDSLTAAELRAKYHQDEEKGLKEKDPTVDETQLTALRAAVGSVLNAHARKQGHQSSPLTRKQIRRLVELKLGLKQKSLDGQRREINRLVDEFREKIFVASSEGRLDEVESLVSARANVNIPNKRGVVPLHLATTKGHIEVVQALLTARAKPDTRMSNGWTPLLYASWKGHEAIVSGLIQARAQLNLRTQDGAVALTWAAREGNVGIIRALADAKADPMARDLIQKMTPRQHAEIQNRTEAAKLLLGLEEKRTEEKKMAEFRARLQYPEGFEESESDRHPIPETSSNLPNEKECKEELGLEVRAARKFEQRDIAATAGLSSQQRTLRGLDSKEARFGEYCRRSFLLESGLTLVLAVLMFMTPNTVLQSVGFQHAVPIVIDSVPLIGVWVLVKALIGLRRCGRLSQQTVEIWLLSDFLYIYSVVGFARIHPQAWTATNISGLLMTAVWAPIRMYWLMELRGYDPAAPVHSNARPTGKGKNKPRRVLGGTR
ncbi:hypothetical protein AAMO2058_000233500 [Amorphochlora amoebiformis]